MKLAIFITTFIVASTVGYVSAGYQSIAGYYPSTQVTDHSAIDLDLAAIENLLENHTDESFALAKRIYYEGAHRRPYAHITLTEPLGMAILKDTHFFMGKTESGSTVTGNAGDNFPVGSTRIQIRYTASDDQRNYVRCRVGPLPVSVPPAVGDRMTSGCFAPSGMITMMTPDPKLEYNYTYNPLIDNKSYRHLYTFSDRGGWHTDYWYAVNYYGTRLWGDQWIQAAFNGTVTQFTNGNADFSGYTFAGKEVAITKGIVVLNTFMYAINELANHTQIYCANAALSGKWKTLHAWDEGAAFYTGSQDAARPGSGNLVYSLADNLCKEWRTCGVGGNTTSGKSKVNIDITNLLTQGQEIIRNGGCANQLPAVYNKIAERMYIILIQGVLSYAYKASELGSFDEVVNAAMATYAAGVLPRVHHANATAAAIIHDNTKVGVSETDYDAVLSAFQSVYPALGLTQTDIGTNVAIKPTKMPTVPPTFTPTKMPTLPPTFKPTKMPTLLPTMRPTKVPTLPPTMKPTKMPTSSS